MSGLDISLLGEVTIHREGAVVPCPSAKALELFCYLLTYRGQSHTRAALSEVLWPDKSPDLSKRYLRQALWKLNAAFQSQDGPERGPDVLLAPQPGWLRINPPVFQRLDTEDLERVHAVVSDVPGAQLAGDQAVAIERVLARGTGEFLAGWQQEWCLPERARLEEIRLGGLEQLIAYSGSRRLFAKGLSFGRSVLAVAPARETTHRLLMRLHHRMGDRAAAVRQFQQCTSALQQEFGIQPSLDTVRLHRAICADDAPPPELLPGSSPSALTTVRAEVHSEVHPEVHPEVRPEPWVAMQAQLDQMQATLNTLARFMEDRNTLTRSVLPVSRARSAPEPA